MKPFLVLICALASVASFAHAEEPAALPSRHEIRDRYEEFAAQSGELPQTALLVFAATEDRHFFEKLQQRSTITLFVARRYLPPRSGRLHRLAVSVALGNALTHEEILNWYVGEIFLGQSCFGIADAAHAYFGKPVQALEIEELAFLAGISKAPALFHPIRSHEKALQRRNFAITQMAKLGLISEAKAEETSHKPLITLSPLQRCELEE